VIRALAVGLGMAAALGWAAPARAQLFGESGSQTRPQVQTEWRQEDYNPNPLAGDLDLPMPCGGAMTFRPVVINAVGFLDDTRVTIGGSDPEVGWREDRVTAHIAGAFTDPDNASRRVFYIAKYEVSVLQYQAVMEGIADPQACPRPRGRLRLPITDVSWFDGIAFTRAYTEWLLTNAREYLPHEDDEPGYIRLPTEVEWEFAARGGLAVDSADYLADRFPMPDGDLAQYAWYQGTQSANGRLNPVGLLRPNPLGLHDMLGNASEIMLDPFRLNRRGRLHGQTGGMVVRGGDFLTSADQMRTALRLEYSWFDARRNVAASTDSIGLRMVLSVPAVPSPERLQEVAEEWEELPAPDTGTEAGQLEQRAVASLSNLTGQMSDSAMQQELSQALATLEQAATERNEIRDRAVRALLRVGAFLGAQLRSDHRRMGALLQTLEITEDNLAQLTDLRQRANAAGNREAVARADQAIDNARTSLAGMQERQANFQADLDRTESLYGDTVEDMAGDYSMTVLEPQMAALQVELQEAGLTELSELASLFTRHIADFQTTGRLPLDDWIAEIVE